jgi:hypothetical protein
MALASAVIPGLESGSLPAEDTHLEAVRVEVPEPPATSEVEGLLDQLQVAPEGSRDGYERDAFKHWIDADGDGCDTRKEVLIEEALAPVSEGPACSVTEGEWFSVYDGIAFMAAGGLDIDHMVPLGEAWDSGASAWDSFRRQDYANDLDHPAALIGVSASSNRSKGDRDPTDWKPLDAGYWCQYAFDWATVKIAWDLSSDSDEVLALQEMLVTCEEDPV